MNQIVLTDQALTQIQLIRDNDYTLESSVLRLSIDGKKCEGFTYAIGFDSIKNDDIQIDLPEDITIAMDPFTAHYCQNVVVDFQLDPENGVDGFVVENNDQKNYQGKFFKDGSNVPDFSTPS